MKMLLNVAFGEYWLDHVHLISGVPLAELEAAPKKALRRSCPSLPFSFPLHAKASLSL